MIVRIIAPAPSPRPPERTAVRVARTARRMRLDEAGWAGEVVPSNVHPRCPPLDPLGRVTPITPRRTLGNLPAPVNETERAEAHLGPFGGRRSREVGRRHRSYHPNMRASRHCVPWPPG
ncbi:hypothetical protein GCM10009608_08310 [Pseudonocardia alaniniphila]